MDRINPQIWYGNRELDFVPPHFTKCSTPLTTESLLWVHTRLQGRFFITSLTNLQTFVLDTTKQIYFEDPAEATMYELRWSGGK